jgi:hypothetical protein
MQNIKEVEKRRIPKGILKGKLKGILKGKLKGILKGKLKGK